MTEDCHLVFAGQERFLNLWDKYVTQRKFFRLVALVKFPFCNLSGKKNGRRCQFRPGRMKEKGANHVVRLNVYRLREALVVEGSRKASGGMV